MVNPFEVSARKQGKAKGRDRARPGAPLKLPIRKTASAASRHGALGTAAAAKQKTNEATQAKQTSGSAAEHASAAAGRGEFVAASPCEIFVGLASARPTQHLNCAPEEVVREVARDALARYTPFRCHTLTDHAQLGVPTNAAIVIFEDEATAARALASLQTGRGSLESTDVLRAGGTGWQKRAFAALTSACQLGHTTDTPTAVVLSATPVPHAAASFALARVAARAWATKRPPQTSAGRPLKNVPANRKELADALRKELLNADPLFVSRYLGKLTGRPLPAAEAEAVLRILDALDWDAMGNVRAASIDVQNSFSLGLSTKALAPPPKALSASDVSPSEADDITRARALLTSDPYRTPFAFKDSVGFWDGGKVVRKHRELYDACMALLHAIDPNFHATSIGFNKNFRGSPHRDEKDAGLQVVCGFGDYEGGNLRVQASGGTADIETRGRYVMVDGRYRHSVQPFQGGCRYSVVFYALEPQCAVLASSTVENIGL